MRLYDNYSVDIQEPTSGIISITPSYKMKYWSGVAAATKQAFPNHININLDFKTQDLEAMLKVIKFGNFHTLILGGFPPIFDKVVKFFTVNSDMPIFVTWHGSTSQWHGSYDAGGMLALIAQVKAGRIRRVGFVKKGMEDFADALFDIDSVFLPNLCVDIPTSASSGPENAVGMYIVNTDWKKLQSPSIAACAMFDDLQLHIYGAAESKPRTRRNVQRMITSYAMKHRCHLHELVPFDKRLDVMRSNALTLYVTYSECAPMLPLESFSVGTPCLTGNTHHYFDYPIKSPLHKSMIVKKADDATLIADHIEHALTYRDIIIEQYIKWATEYNEWCYSEIEKFIV